MVFWKSQFVAKNQIATDFATKASTMNVTIDELIAALETEKGTISEEIVKLRRRIAEIDNIIYQTKLKAAIITSGESINKKNVGRIYNESLILDIIRNKSGINTKKINDILKKNGHSLSYPTVRSYLHRMQQKGIISRKHGSYGWELAK